LERLRLMIIDRELPPLTFYPMILLQYSTRADHHNRTPIRWRGPEASLEVPHLPQFKFYMDGLAALVLPPLDQIPSAIVDMVVGAGPDLTVQTMEFERSEQRANLLLAVREALFRGIK
jgi:hypothetical protein